MSRIPAKPTVYRMYDEAGDLLYVGVSIKAANRIQCHSNKEWWTDIHTVRLEHFATIDEALKAEGHALLTEGARYVKSRKSGHYPLAVVSRLDAEDRGEAPNRIEELRRARGLRQAHLAVELGCTEATISRYEAGRPIPDAAKTKLAEFFGVSVVYLMRWDEPTQDQAA